MDNRPQGRDTHVTGAGKDIKRRGEGLNTGPVGSTPSHGSSQGSRPAQPGNRPTGRSSSQVRQQGAYDQAGGGQRASGGGSPLIKIILAAVVLLGGGGFGLSSLLGGGGETTTTSSGYTQTYAPSSYQSGGQSAYQGGSFASGILMSHW